MPPHERLDRYQCEEVFRRFDDYIDRRLTTQEQELMEEHLAICERCLKELQFEEAVVREIRARVARVQVPAAFKNRLFQVLAQAGEPGTGTESGTEE